MKFLRKLILVLLSLIIITIATAYIYLHSLKPQYSGELKLTGLKEEAEVFFDDYGIPHIYAKNEEDAFFALGYVHAQDRLFQMEMLRRVGSGRLAEVLGKELLDIDRFFRTLGIAQHAKESEKLFMNGNSEPLAVSHAEPYQKLALAYVAGINQYIEKGKTPLEFTLIGIPKEKFTPLDLYLISGYMSYSFSLTLRTEPILTRIQQKFGENYLNDLVPGWSSATLKIPIDKTAALTPPLLKERGMGSEASPPLRGGWEGLLPVPPWLGSNSWVLGPQKTKSGKVMFCNDTHIGYAQPSVWYEAHLECPELSLYGNFLAGFPFPLVGHNKFAAIGLTMFENDDMDLFREKQNPENPEQVWVNDHWENMSMREEVIKIKNEEDTVIKIRTTRHGPIINEVVKDVALSETEPVSAWWIFTEFPAQTLQASYLFSHAKKMDDVRFAASLVHAPGLNVMYGDADGNIAWWAAAKIVKRPPQVNPLLILDGASGNEEPLGYYDFAENPRSENPLCGFVCSANTQPDSMPDGNSCPGYYVPDHRKQCIIQHLSSDKKWDTEEMKNMITEVVSTVYPEWSKEILRNINAEELEKYPDFKPVSKELTEWNGDHQPGDVAPVIFYKLLYRILENSMMDELGEEDFNSFLMTHQLKTMLPGFIYNDTSSWWDNITTTGITENRKMIFTKSFSEMIEQLEKQLGKDISQWKWERVHTIEHIHPIGRKEPFDKVFNVGPYPVKGGNEVINNIGFTLNASGEYKAKFGPAMRRIIDFGDLENSWSVLPTGQSGNLMSDHYSDQAKMYNEGIFRKQMMNRKDIEEKNKGKLVLLPE